MSLHSQHSGLTVQSLLSSWFHSCASLLVPLLFLPWILAWQILKYTFAPLFIETARCIRQANDFWGWPVVIATARKHILQVRHWAAVGKRRQHCKNTLLRKRSTSSASR